MRLSLPPRMHENRVSACWQDWFGPMEAAEAPCEELKSRKQGAAFGMPRFLIMLGAKYRDPSQDVNASSVYTIIYNT